MIVCYRPDGSPDPDHPRPAALLAGSFNPLHFGHRQLAEIVSNRLSREVHFELSIANVDKPDLTAVEVERRVAQFRDYAPVWITRAPTFAEKAEHFPGTSFVVGWDTAVRLVDPKYYAQSLVQRDAALARLLEHRCRFLVAGRLDAAGQFRTWNLAEWSELFEVIDEGEFRADVSSTELRTR